MVRSRAKGAAAPGTGSVALARTASTSDGSCANNMARALVLIEGLAVGAVFAAGWLGLGWIRHQRRLSRLGQRSPEFSPTQFAELFEREGINPSVALSVHAVLSRLGMGEGAAIYPHDALDEVFGIGGRYGLDSLLDVLEQSVESCGCRTLTREELWHLPELRMVADLVRMVQRVCIGAYPG